MGTESRRDGNNNRTYIVVYRTGFLNGRGENTDMIAFEMKSEAILIRTRISKSGSGVDVHRNIREVVGDELSPRLETYRSSCIAISILQSYYNITQCDKIF